MRPGHRRRSRSSCRWDLERFSSNPPCHPGSVGGSRRSRDRPVFSRSGSSSWTTGSCSGIMFLRGIIPPSSCYFWAMQNSSSGGGLDPRIDEVIPEGWDDCRPASGWPARSGAPGRPAQPVGPRGHVNPRPEVRVPMGWGRLRRTRFGYHTRRTEPGWRDHAAHLPFGTLGCCAANNRAGRRRVRVPPHPDTEWCCNRDLLLADRCHQTIHRTCCLANVLSQDMFAMVRGAHRGPGGAGSTTWAVGTAANYHDFMTLERNPARSTRDGTQARRYTCWGPGPTDPGRGWGPAPGLPGHPKRDADIRGDVDGVRNSPGQRQPRTACTRTRTARRGRFRLVRRPRFVAQAIQRGVRFPGQLEVREGR